MLQWFKDKWDGNNNDNYKKGLRSDIDRVGRHFTKADSTYYVDNVAKVLKEDPEKVGNAFSKVMDYPLHYGVKEGDMLKGHNARHFPSGVISVDTTRASDWSYPEEYRREGIENVSDDTYNPSNWRSSLWHEAGHGLLNKLYGYRDKGHPQRGETFPEWIETLYTDNRGGDNLIGTDGLPGGFSKEHGYATNTIDSIIKDAKEKFTKKVSNRRFLKNLKSK
jgi:hypothetical protein|tara:strand:+ start:596 stop:1258 length:663 start_codon:yes stop_codon:yes gene_type:complete